MYTLHATVASSRDWFATTPSPAVGGPGAHRPAAAFGAVLWAAVAALLAVSSVAFAGPVDLGACSGPIRTDARWVTRLGRPDHRPLSLMATDSEVEAGSPIDSSRAPGFAAADERWWVHVGVPEGVTVASHMANGIASGALDRLFCGVHHDGDARRFFIGDDADGLHQLRKAEAAISGNAALRTAYATYAAAASLTSAADRFLGLATPVFGTRFRLPASTATGWEPLGGGRSSGAVPAVGARPSFRSGEAVPVGTDGDSSIVRPRTAASGPSAPSSGMLTTILGNSGGLMVWQLSRRRKTAVRNRNAAAG